MMSEGHKMCPVDSFCSSSRTPRVVSHPSSGHHAKTKISKCGILQIITYLCYSEK